MPARAARHQQRALQIEAPRRDLAQAPADALAQRPDAALGRACIVDVELRQVAVRTRRPYVEATQGSVTSRYSGDIRGRLLADGYDSIIVNNSDGGGGDWVIGLKNEDIKIVVEDAADALDVRPMYPTKLDRSQIR